MRNEKLHKTWHADYIPTIEETIKMIDMWLSFKNSQSCPNAPDKTIAEVLSERKRQNIDINTLDDIQKFYYFCKGKNLPPKVLKNTLALLNQMIKYFQNLGIIDRTCNFQVRRLSDKTNFTVDRIIFEV